jgi:hypothetical protein
MKYDVQYESVKDDINPKDFFWFSRVRDSANKHKVELSDGDFMRLLKLVKRDKDYDWILHQMGVYKKTLIDTLINYITY